MSTTTETQTATATTAAAPAKAKSSHYKFNPVLRDKLRVLRASSPIYSNTQLGAKLGYSAAVLSRYLADDGCKYDGNITALEKKIEDLLNALERRRATSVETIPSEVSKEMLSAFEHIRKTNDLGAIIAESGEGKTRGIELIIQKHELAILIEVTEWCCDKHAIMSALWRGCAVDGWDRQTDRFSYLVQKMRGSDRPIIFDDAHKCSRPALALIATFQEKTNCPVAMVGTPDLVQKLQSDESGQVPSRAGISWPVKIKSQDKDLLLHHVQRIAKDVNGELDELLELCAQVSAHHGHVRAVRKQLKLAAELRHTGKFETWCEAFKGAHEYLLRGYKLT